MTLQTTSSPNPQLRKKLLLIIFFGLGILLSSLFLGGLKSPLGSCVYMIGWIVEASGIGTSCYLTFKNRI